MTVSGSENHSISSITRIEFLWGLSGVESPHDAVAMIKAIRLFQNQPNPFSPDTRITFELPLAGKVKLEIYGPDGRRVRSLLDDVREEGQHEVYWDGLNDSGRKVSRGVYFCSLKAHGIAESRKMILLP